MPNNQQELLDIINANLAAGRSEDEIAGVISDYESKEQSDDVYVPESTGVQKPIIPEIAKGAIDEQIEAIDLEKFFPGEFSGKNQEEEKEDFVYRNKEETTPPENIGPTFEAAEKEELTEEEKIKRDIQPRFPEIKVPDVKINQEKTEDNQEVEGYKNVNEKTTVEPVKDDEEKVDIALPTNDADALVVAPVILPEVIVPEYHINDDGMLELDDENYFDEEEFIPGQPMDPFYNSKKNIRKIKNAVVPLAKIAKNFLTDSEERRQIIDESEKIMKNTWTGLKQSYQQSSMWWNNVLEGAGDNVWKYIQPENCYDGVVHRIKMDRHHGDAISLRSGILNVFFKPDDEFSYDKDNLVWMSPDAKINPETGKYNVYQNSIDYMEVKRSDIRKATEMAGPKNPSMEWTYTYYNYLRGLASEREAEGWVAVYKDTGKAVGHAYQDWQIEKFKKVNAIESTRLKTDVGFVKGYKEADPSMFIGAMVQSLAALGETMVPALVTQGATLIPQITGPMYVQYNRELAGRLYPHLEFEDAFKKMQENGDEEILIPTVLGLAATSLEWIGMKGIVSAMMGLKAGAAKTIVNVILAGNGEGLTEWGQFGIETYNAAYAKHNSHEIASIVAADAMASPDGLEMYLMGAFGGSFVSGGGQIIQRALMRAPSSITYINDRLNEIAKLKKYDFRTQEGKEAIQRKINKLNAEIEEHIESNKKINKYLTKTQKKQLKDLLNKHSVDYTKFTSTYHTFISQKIGGKSIYDLAMEANMTPEKYMEKYHPNLYNEYKAVRESILSDLKDTQEKIEAIKTEANNYLLEKGIIFATGKVGQENITVFENGIEFDIWLAENMDYLMDLHKKDPAKWPHPNKYRSASGFVMQDKSGKKHIFINREVANKVGAVSVAEHEVGHFIFGHLLRDSEGNITPEGKKLMKDFLKKLSPRARAIIETRFNASYDKNNDNNLEEYLTLWINAVRDGDIDRTDGLGALAFLRNKKIEALREVGFDKAKFKTVDDVFTWLNAYILDAQSKDSDVKRASTTENNAPTSFSINLKPGFDKFGKQTQEEFNEDGADDAITWMFGKFDNLIGATITDQMREGENWTSDEDYIMDVYVKLIRHVKNFNVTNNSLWGWVVPYIRRKGWETLKDRKVKPPSPSKPTSLNDPDAFVTQVESDEYVDIELEIENDQTFTKLLNLLGIIRETTDKDGKIIKGDKNYYKIKDAAYKFYSLEINNVEDKKFLNKAKEHFIATLYDMIKGLVGGKPGSAEYKLWIKKNAENLYNLFPQQIFNKMFPEFIQKGKRLTTVEEVDAAISKGDLPKNTNRYSGPYVYTKKPYSEVKQEWEDNFLNPKKGRVNSKQEGLVKLLSWFIGFDASMEVLNSKEFLKNNDVTSATIATIGMKIDRGGNVMFMDPTGNSSITLNEKSGEQFTNHAMQQVKWLVDYVRNPEEVSLEELETILNAEFDNHDPTTTKFVVGLYDVGQILNASSVRFKQKIQKSKILPQWLKDKIKEDGNIRYNESVLDNIRDAAITMSTELGPEAMSKIEYEIFGFINRVLDPAKNKNDGSQGKYYKDLESLKARVSELGGNISPELETALNDMRKMNKKYPLFKKIEKIQYDGTTTGDFETNLEWKISELQKLAPEIEDANSANKFIFRQIAKIIIKSKSITLDTAAHILQIQTSIVGGFRALSSLDLVQLLDGSQEPGPKHVLWDKVYDYVSNAKNKKGELKFKTKEARVKEATRLLGTKGEHAVDNSSTMFDILELKHKYDKGLISEEQLDVELEKITSGHGQVIATKYNCDVLDDAAGANNEEGHRKLFVNSDRNDYYSPSGKNSDIVIAEQTLISEVNTMFSVKKKSTITDPKPELETEFDAILEETEVELNDSKFTKIVAGVFQPIWDFIYPASAYDFELFLYRMLAKGKVGERQWNWFKENLLKPYEEAYIKINKNAQEVKDKYRELVKKMPKIRKSLSKKIPGSNLTYDQAIRIYLWNKAGYKIPGIKPGELEDAKKAIGGDAMYKAFADALSRISGLDKGWVEPGESWKVENIAYDLQFLGETSRKEFLTNWKQNIDIIFSKENRAKLLELYGPDFIEALDDMLYRMETGKAKAGPSRIERNWANWVNNSVGAIMFFNMRSAVLQTISAINFVDWQDNNPAAAAKAFGDQKQFWKDFILIFNSEYLKRRRDKNARTINEDELTKWLKGKTNKAKAVLAFLLEKGFFPTQMADSFAIASGGATFYRTKINALLTRINPKTNEKYTLEEAEAEAMIQLQQRSEKAQQSSRPDLISQQQASGLGRLILAFKNTPMQYNRIMIKAIMDIKNRRGSTGGNLSKVAYYGLMQNLIFTSLQSALWAALGDEEEWDTKTERIANNMIDSILSGLGLTGAVASTLKNTYLRYRKEKKRGWGADHARTIIEFANLSPTIGSKLRKLYSGILTEKINQEAIEEMGLTIKNPQFAAWANMISALTNIPVDRVVKKINNIMLAADDETEVSQAIGLMLGWNSWDLGMESTFEKANKKAKEKKKKEKAEREKPCKGKSKSTGRSCGNMTENSNGYCYAHQSQAPKKSK